MNNFLKDSAKVLVGVVATKIGFCIWLITANLLPINIIGIEWGFAINMISILTGFVILILLVYYAWFWKAKKKEKMQTLTDGREI